MGEVAPFHGAAEENSDYHCNHESQGLDWTDFVDLSSFEEL